MTPLDAVAPGRGPATEAAHGEAHPPHGRHGPAELVLVRHAETTAGAGGRYLGWGDAPLTAAGEAEARRVGPLVGTADLVVSSDLPRALRTAELALPGRPVVREPRLRELHFGSFEGGTWAENQARHGARFRAWLRDPRAVAPPGGETVAELEARVRAWLEELPRRGRVVVFLHGGSLRAAVAILEGRPTEALLGAGVPTCAPVVVRLDSRPPLSPSRGGAPSR